MSSSSFSSSLQGVSIRLTVDVTSVYASFAVVSFQWDHDSIQFFVSQDCSQNKIPLFILIISPGFLILSSTLAVNIAYIQFNSYLFIFYMIPSQTLRRNSISDAACMLQLYFCCIFLQLPLTYVRLWFQESLSFIALVF